MPIPDASTTAPSRSPRRVSTWTWALLALLTAASAVLRLGALHRLLPVHPDPDFSLVVMYCTLAGDHQPNEELHFGAYPTLLPHVLALVLPASTLQPAAPDAALADHIAAASAPFVRMRALIALLSVLLVPLTFLLARRWLEDRWALLAAALVASSLLHVAHSSVAKAHGAHATLAWLALLLALGQVERTTVARCAATALAGALAIGAFHSGFFLMLPLGVAALLAWPLRGSAGLGPRVSKAARASAWLTPLLALAGGLLFTPGGVDLGSGRVKLGRGHSIAFGNLDGRGLQLWTSFLWEHDPVLCVLAACGLVVLLRGCARHLRDARLCADALVLGAYALPYTLLLSLDNNVQDRYLLPLLPLFAVAAVLALRAVLGRARAPAALALAATAVLAFPTWVAVRFTLLGRKATTLEQCAAWLRTNPSGPEVSVRLAPSVTPPLFPTDAALAAQLATSAGAWQPWFHYLRRLDHVPRSEPGWDLRPLKATLITTSEAKTHDEIAGEIDREAPDLVVFEVSKRMTYAAGAATLREVLREHGELVASFSGEGGRHGQDMAIDYQGVRDLARRVLAADRLGPDLEVYRWPRP